MVHDRDRSDRVAQKSVSFAATALFGQGATAWTPVEKTWRCRHAGIVRQVSSCREGLFIGGLSRTTVEVAAESDPSISTANSDAVGETIKPGT